MRGDVSDETFEDLLRAIYKAPRLSPPALGRKPEFTAHENRTTVRLATLEIDGFYLNSGVVSAEIYPDTFIIPSEEERQAVKPTDLVKLSFELQQLIVDDEEDVHIEKDAPLTFDSEVTFLPEHIISIQTAEEAEESRRRAGL